MRCWRKWISSLLIVFALFALAGCGQGLKKENEQLKAEVGTLQKENTDLKAQLTELQTKNDALQQELDQTKQELAQLSEKMKGGAKKK